jgi:uncharacterized protein (DUF2267 family)
MRLPHAPDRSDAWRACDSRLSAKAESHASTRQSSRPVRRGESTSSASRPTGNDNVAAKRKRRRTEVFTMTTATTASGASQPTTGVHVFDRALQTGNHWIQEIMTELCQDDPIEAQRALRTVLHVLRDRLPTAEALHFSSQLPLLVSAVFMENYVLREKPIKYSRDEFLQEIADRLIANNTRKPDPMRYLQAVACVLTRHLSPGSLDKALGCLPEDLRTLWRTAAEDGEVTSRADEDQSDVEQ